MSSRANASRRRSTATRSRGDAEQGQRRRLLPAALTRGQRPFVFAFLALLVLLATMAATPAQRYVEMQQRVDSLTQKREELAAEVDTLEKRKARLRDPDEIELLARRELGLVRPGEISYVVVRPEEGQQPGVTARDPEPVADDDKPWWRRLGETLGLLGDGGRSS